MSFNDKRTNFSENARFSVFSFFDFFSPLGCFGSFSLVFFRTSGFSTSGSSTFGSGSIRVCAARISSSFSFGTGVSGSGKFNQKVRFFYSPELCSTIMLWSPSSSSSFSNTDLLMASTLIFERTPWGSAWYCENTVLISI